MAVEVFRKRWRSMASHDRWGNAMGQPRGDDTIWEAYLLCVANSLLRCLSPTYCLAAYYDYLDFRLESLREVLMDLHTHISDRYEPYCAMIEAACDVLTSLRLQRIGESQSMCRVATALSPRSPCDREFFGPLDLTTIQSSLNPDMYIQTVADELDFLASVDIDVPVPANVNWRSLSHLWKELMSISRHINLQTLD